MGTTCSPSAKIVGMTAIDIPMALHRGENDLPFVDLGDGSDLQLLQCDVEAGLWVIRTRFQPGYVVQTHKHTGEVFAFTLSGSWKYAEYPDVNTAGSYLYEPAGSIHTLTVPETNEGLTDVWFAIRGANLNLDEDGNVTMAIDAGLMREFYLAACEDQGLGRPDVIGL
jgi:2,4'-dihydroxyacetophenone dioxygenase